MVIKPGETIDIIGEGNLIPLTPGFQAQNMNNPTGELQLDPTNPPAAQTGSLYVVTKQQLSIVPFVLTYLENPEYQPKGTFHIATLEERVAQAAVIVHGVAETSAPDGRNTLATIRVKLWLKGNGPAQISVGDFINTSCDYQIAAGEERVFFLRQEGEIYYLNNLQVGMSDAWARPEDAGEIIRVIGQEPVMPTAVVSAAPSSGNGSEIAVDPELPGDPAAGTPGNLPRWLFIATPIALIGGFYLWRHQRSGGKDRTTLGGKGN